MNLPNFLVQSSQKLVSEERLKVLSSPQTETLIMKKLETLKDVEENIDKIEQLTIAPNLSYSDDILVILVFLKEPVYICSAFLEETIAKILNCKERDLRILTTQMISNSYQLGSLDKKQYTKLLFASLPLKDFKVSTNEDLNKQFDSNYEKFQKLSPQESERQIQKMVDKMIGKKNGSHQAQDQPMQLKIRFVPAKYKPKDKVLNPRIKTLSEYTAEEEIAHLKTLADKYYKEIDEKKCDVIIQHLEKMETIQSGETTILHLVASRQTSLKGVTLSIGEAMAIIKRLLGVDPKLTTDESIIVSSSPKIKDVNCKDAKGRTPLHLAARTAGGVIYWLLVLGADPTILDKEDNTVLGQISNSWVHVKTAVEKYVKNW